MTGGTKASAGVDPKTIVAMPTRDFFIDMVTRDIPLDAVVLDLVDNSVDGAKRLRGTGTFDGLEVRIEANPSQFSIVDNCGGFSSAVARDYAFRFGRVSGEEGARGTPWAVGTFGIGMKRAIFRLGRKFYIRSTWEKSLFEVEEDVEVWRKKGDGPWEFHFKKLDESTHHTTEKRGTEVRVTHLFPGVADAFKVESYPTDLASWIGERHRAALEKGLHVSVNGVPAKVGFVEILQSKLIKPILIDKTERPNPRTTLRTRIYAGIGRVPEELPQDRADEDSGSDLASSDLAGWYVYCNGRELLHADKTRLTGWGDGNPEYHPQYSMFRGYVFFDCANPSLLPWNTTKTGVESEHAAFQKARLLMIPALRQAIKLMNARDRELDIIKGPTPITDAIRAASSVVLEKVRPSEELVRPAEVPPVRRPQKTEAKIAYTEPIEIFELARERLGIRGRRPGPVVGRKTFQYYVDHELN